MPLFKVEVTRTVKSTKQFVVQAADVKSAEAAAIAAACEEDEIGQDVGGWIEDLDWLAEALYHEPRVGDVVKLVTPNKGEEGFRFDLLEIDSRNDGRKTALIRLICSFAFKPVERVAYDQICLAETED